MIMAQKMHRPYRTPSATLHLHAHGSTYLLAWYVGLLCSATLIVGILLGSIIRDNNLIQGVSSYVESSLHWPLLAHKANQNHATKSNVALLPARPVLSDQEILLIKQQKLVKVLTDKYSVSEDLAKSTVAYTLSAAQKTIIPQSILLAIIAKESAFVEIPGPLGWMKIRAGDYPYEAQAVSSSGININSTEGNILLAAYVLQSNKADASGDTDAAIEKIYSNKADSTHAYVKEIESLKSNFE